MTTQPNMMTETDAMHLVAREVAKQRMGDMERKINENDSKTSLALLEIKAQISQVITMIKEQTAKQEENRKEFKKEIEDEFASKIDLERLENKLDQMFLKITVTVGTLISVGLLIEWAVSVANGFKSLAG